MTSLQDDIRYRAFISYSHRDRQWGEWLHRKLESYRVPQNIVGKETAYGPIPRRLTPIFRDRDELSAAEDLSAEITAALQASMFLVVICSPASAASRWVNEEIKAFKKMHGDARVRAVIVGGAPFSGDPATECFPEAMRFRFNAEGEMTDDRAEPIAADLRPEGDGKKYAVSKLVAGLTGATLDELIRREQMRRNARLRAVAGGMTAIAASMGALAWNAMLARNEAQAQRTEAVAARDDAEDLVEYMVTDLRSALDAVGRLDVLDSVGERILDYYEARDLTTADPDALGRRARALHLVGEVSDLSGNGERSLAAFQEAARVTEELLRRDPENWQRAFDHAQSVFWLAYAETERGDNDAAMAHFIEYRDLGRRMVAIDPGKPESQMELAYGETNVGTGLVKQNRLKEALTAFQGALSAFEQITPRTREVALSISGAASHVASTLYKLDDVGLSIEAREKQLAVLNSPPLASGDDKEVEEARAIAWALLGEARFIQGNMERAQTATNKAIDLWKELTAADPDNLFWAEQYTRSLMRKAIIDIIRQDNENARITLDSTESILNMVLRKSPENEFAKISMLKFLSIKTYVANDPLSEHQLELLKKYLAPTQDTKEITDLESVTDYAAALIALGDMELNKDPNYAINLWRRAADLITAMDAPDTWAVLQGLRTDKRLNQNKFSKMADEKRVSLEESVGGLFASELEIIWASAKEGESNVDTGFNND